MLEREKGKRKLERPPRRLHLFFLFLFLLSVEETGTPNLLFSLCNVVGDIRGILLSYLWPSITESDPLLSSLNGLASLALFTVSAGRGEEERGASALLLAV